MLDSLARERVDARAPRVVLIAGEAGLGKTTLAANAARAAHEDGACVLFGHCEQGLSAPYQLFSRALEHYVRHAPEEHLRDHVAEHGSALVRLAPSLARRIPDLPPTRATDPESERFLLFAAVVGLLVDVSSTTAIVVWCSTTSSGRTRLRSRCCVTSPRPTSPSSCSCFATVP